MRQHRGMRSHDIVILLKLASLGDEKWYIKNVARDLGISQSEVSESLNRSKIAGLLSSDKKILMKNNLLDFLEFGLRYVFPVEPGAIQRGMPTAHSAPPLTNIISANDSYVWPWAGGQSRGQAVEPLHPAVPSACANDPILYELLTLADALRIGRARERQQAIKELRRRLLSKKDALYQGGKSAVK